MRSFQTTFNFQKDHAFPSQILVERFASLINSVQPSRFQRLLGIVLIEADKYYDCILLVYKKVGLPYNRHCACKLNAPREPR